MNNFFSIRKTQRELAAMNSVFVSLHLLSKYELDDARQKELLSVGDKLLVQIESLTSDLKKIVEQVMASDNLS